MIQNNLVHVVCLGVLLIGYDDDHHHHVHEGLGVFLNPQDEVGPSISSLVVLCFFVLSVFILSVGPLLPFEDFTGYETL
jgi:hypothetical protein